LCLQTDGDHLVQHRAERENIGTRIDLPALGLLRGHVGDRADDRPFFCMNVFPGGDRRRAGLGIESGIDSRLHKLGQTEIQQFYAAFLADNDVRRLEIAVYDSGRMGAGQGVGNLNRVFQSVVQRRPLLPINRSSVLPSTNSMAM